MASDNTILSINVGVGDTFRDLADGGGIKWPVAVSCYALSVSAGNNSLQIVDATHGLPVAVVGSVAVTGTFWQTTQPVSIAASVAVTAANLPLPAGAATAAKQPALGTAGAASADVITVQGVASMTALKVDGSAVTQPVSGTVTANAGTGTFTVSGTVTVGNATLAVTQSGTWTVGISAAQTVAVTNAGTFAVQVSSALPAGTNVIGHVIVDSGTITTVSTVTVVTAVTSLTQFNGVAITLNKGASDAGTLRVALGDGTQVIGALTANQSVNVAQINGVTATMGNGISGTGVQRVTLASDSTGQVALAAGSAVIGHVIVDSGTVTTVTAVTAITNALPAGTNTIGGVYQVPQTSGGPTVARIKAASGTNATNVKASAGQVYGYALYNGAATMRAVHFYNSASAPTAGSGTPLFTVLLPATGGANLEFSLGIPFGTGIGYTITTGASDTDTGSCSADDVHGVLLYK